MFEPHVAEQPFFVALTQSPDLTHSLTSDREKGIRNYLTKLTKNVTRLNSLHLLW